MPSNRCENCKYSKYTYSPVMHVRVHECTYKGDSACSKCGRKKGTQKEQTM